MPVRASILQPAVAAFVNQFINLAVNALARDEDFS